jgi:hypothetical protein
MEKLLKDFFMLRGTPEILLHIPRKPLPEKHTVTKCNLKREVTKT